MQYPVIQEKYTGQKKTVWPAVVLIGFWKIPEKTCAEAADFSFQGVFVLLQENAHLYPPHALRRILLFLQAV